MANFANFCVIEGNGRGTKVYVSDNFIYSTNRTVGITRYLRDTIMSENRDVSFWVRDMMCLALVPCYRIVSVFQTQLHPSTLPDDYSTKDAIVNFYEYVDRYWLSLVGPQRFCVFKAKWRTNAAVESSNNSLKLRFQIAHPNFWTFYDRLSRIIFFNEIEIDQVRGGGTVRRESIKRYDVIERRIRAAETLYEHGKVDASQFLQRASYQVSLLKIKRSFDVEGDDSQFSSNAGLPSVPIPAAIAVSNIPVQSVVGEYQYAQPADLDTANDNHDSDTGPGACSENEDVATNFSSNNNNADKNVNATMDRRLIALAMMR